MTLLDAVYALDEIAEGRIPDRARLLAGALALRRQSTADSDLLDAAVGLDLLAKGGTLDLNASGQAHAAVLAAAVRRAHPTVSK